MLQSYHKKAKTNQHSRTIIQESGAKNTSLALRFGVNIKTIAKWRSRRFVEDKSSKPNTISRSLNEFEREVIRVIRTLTWLNLDDLVDSVLPNIPKSNRSNVYRTLVNFGLNKVPEKERLKANKFKEYEPGYLHIDVTYLPKLEGKKHYLFVAIDRATRLIYFKVYARKTAENAADFLSQCKEYFPFYISHVLTDNGLEFTDKFVSKNKQPSGKHLFDHACISPDEQPQKTIEHRLTKPRTPQTNGMVERLNGTIKSATIKSEVYQNYNELELDLTKFLLYYNLSRSHGGLRKELKVKTPLDALFYWYKVSPELFKTSPDRFQAKLKALRKVEQRCET